GFLRALPGALAATLADPAKLARFAAAMRAGGTDDAHREAARKSLEQTRAWFESYNSANRSADPGGFGRMVAVGRIITQAIRFTSGPENSIEPNAPARFPVLWETPRHDR